MNSHTNTNVIRSFLEHHNVSFLQPEADIFLFTFHGRQAAYRVTLHVDDAESFMTTVGLPLSVPIEKRPTFSEFITRINYGLKFGRFELDFSEGDLLWALNLPLIDAELSTQYVQKCMSFGLLVADHHFRGFGRLLFDEELSPAEAFAELRMAAVEQQQA